MIGPSTYSGGSSPPAFSKASVASRFRPTHVRMTARSYATSRSFGAAASNSRSAAIAVSVLPIPRQRDRFFPRDWCRLDERTGSESEAHETPTTRRGVRSLKVG